MWFSRLLKIKRDHFLSLCQDEIMLNQIPVRILPI